MMMAIQQKLRRHMPKKYLFAHFVSPEEHANTERKGYSPTINITTSKNYVRKWWDILIEQCLNACIIGGIAAFASNGDWRISLKAFGITFLIELRKYRKL